MPGRLADEPLDVKTRPISGLRAEAARASHGQDVKPGAEFFLLLIGVVTGLATLLGGAVALRFRSALGLFLGFSSGAVIGVSLFDLLPEALELGRNDHSALTLTTALMLGFGLYLIVDRTSLVLTGGKGGHRSHLGPASLTLHSLMDGLAIGMAFHVNSAAGLVVAFAVLAHDVLDGANTVTLSLAGGSRVGTVKSWLAADALAPVVGISMAWRIAVPASVLSLLLAMFSGCFLYIGASELLPRSHDRRPKLSTLGATILGLGLIYFVVRLAAA